jgi:hypothetical protein
MLSIREIYHAAADLAKRHFEEQGLDVPVQRPPTPIQLRIERREAALRDTGRRPVLRSRYVPEDLLPDPIPMTESLLAQRKAIDDQRMRLIADRIQARLNAAVSTAIAAINEHDRSTAYIAIVRAADAYRQLHEIATDFDFRGLSKESSRYSQAAEFMGATLQDAVGQGQPEKAQFDEAFVAAAAEIEDNAERMRRMNPTTEAAAARMLQ